MANFEDYDSSAFVDMTKSIAHSKQNDILVHRCSEVYTVDGYDMQSPMSVYSEYWDLIENNTITIMIPDTELYRPEEVAKRLYGSRDLAFIIRRLNGVLHNRDFNKNSIIVLNPTRSDVITSILRSAKDKLKQYRTSKTEVKDITLRPIK